MRFAADWCFRWLFEKYDGVRGFWNPLKKAFYSRLGNVLPIPAHIIKSMPTDTFLDGELWYGDVPFRRQLPLNRFGRDRFKEALKISNRLDQSLVDWEHFKYMVFDIPNCSGTYGERYTKLGMSKRAMNSAINAESQRRPSRNPTHLLRLPPTKCAEILSIWRTSSRL